MKPLTYYQIITKYLKSVYESAVLDDKYDAWIVGYNLEKVNTPYGWIGNSGQRRARELSEKGILERKIEGKYVYYRYLPPPKLSPEEQEAESQRMLMEALK